MKGKFSSTVAGAAIFLTIIGVLSKGVGFVREVIFASYFGLSAEFDMYLVGAVLPLTINTIIIYLGQNYIIPAGNRLRKENSGLMQDFLITNFNIFLLSGLLLGGILFLLADPIISLYLHEADADVINTTVIIFRIYLITIPISCAISVLSAYYQLNFQFKYPGYSNLVLNASFIILIILFASRINIMIIPIGYTAASFFQLFYLIRRSEIKFRLAKFSLHQARTYISPVFLIIIMIESIGQLYILADRYFWNYIPAGGLSALNYAQTLFILPVSVLSMALSTAIFPKISESISKKLFSELEDTFNQSIRINIAFFIPITFIMIYYGDYLIALFFERGKFSAGDSLITHKALAYYSISLVFYSIYSIANKMLYGLGIIKQLLYITIAGIILKITLNILLVPGMQQNGLALSTSISYIFFCFSSIFFIYQRLSFKDKYVYLPELFFHIINGFASFITVKLLGSLTADGFSILPEIILFLGISFLNFILVKHSTIDIFLRIISSSGYTGKFKRAGNTK